MPSPVTALTATDPACSVVSSLAGPRGEVGLVEHEQLGHVIGTDLAQHHAHRGDLAVRVGGAGVDDVHQVVGPCRDFERALERLDEPVRQAAHEPDRVGEQDRLTTGQRQPTRRRVEGGEQSILDEHARLGQVVEQRGLAGVRVADDAHRRQPARTATLALQRSGRRQILHVRLELGDAPHDPPAIDLELGLAAAEAGADAAPLLRQLGGRAAPQSRQAVAQERQLDLRLALERVGVLPEDVEDHRGPVDRGSAEQLLEVVLLGGRQLVVEHDRVGVDTDADLAQLLGLALADEPRVIGRVATLHEAGDFVGARGVDEQRQLVEARLGLFVRRTGERDPDDHDAFPDRAVDEGAAEGFVVRGAHVMSISISISIRAT